MGINPSDDRKTILEFLKANRVTFPVLLETSQGATRPMDQALAQYETLKGLSAMPLTYVIDREGKVVGAWYGAGAEQTQKALKQLGL